MGKGWFRHKQSHQCVHVCKVWSCYI